MVRQVHMQGAAAIAPTSEVFAMKHKLFKNIGVFIFNYIEVAVIDITWDNIPIFLISFCVLCTEVLCHSVTFLTNIFLLRLFLRLSPLQAYRKFPEKQFYNLLLFLLNSVLFRQQVDIL